MRAVFELNYDSWDAGGRKVSEVRRVSIDAGSNFSRVESRFASNGPVDIGVGIVEREGAGRYRDGAGWMSYWEPPHGADGSAACAIVMPSARFARNDGHYLAIRQAQPGKPFVYYMGAAWSKSGDFAAPDAWEGAVRDFAVRTANPLKVQLEGAVQAQARKGG